MMKWLYGAATLCGVIGVVTCLIDDQWLAAVWAFSSTMFASQLWLREVFK